VPQLGHAWWGRRASPQWEQGVRFGAVIFWWVRRLSRFDLDFLRLGTAMSKSPYLTNCNYVNYWKHDVSLKVKILVIKTQRVVKKFFMQFLGLIASKSGMYR
jgi:hypothetical protein